MNNKPKNIILHVHGMHCHACVVLTEMELTEHPKVTSAKSSLKKNIVEITGDFENMTEQEIADELNKLLSQHKLSVEKAEKKVNWKEFAIALPIALGFIFVFLVLQKTGLVNLVNTNELTFPTIFIIGVIASLSTCMAVVGGLVLSVSATFAREGDKLRPQLYFHAGRLVSFFLLGGAIGMLGASFQLSAMGIFILGIVVGLIMLILGINLLDVFHFTKRLQPSMPKFISKKVLKINELNHTLTPLLIGIATFFLPCGFTQSMQVYTLTTGSFLQGGLTMLAYALGTLPVLGLISFSSFSIQNNAKAGIFFKSAGLIVILFALFNILNSFAAIGWIQPIFNF
jgi:sulfite exporter TauE/SafE/copper chaperone CopZ